MNNEITIKQELIDNPNGSHQVAHWAGGSHMRGKLSEQLAIVRLKYKPSRYHRLEAKIWDRVEEILGGVTTDEDELLNQPVN